MAAFPWPIYCINLARRADRRLRMERRFAQHQLEARFVTAVDRDDPELEPRLVGAPTWVVETESGRATAACLASHLKCLRLLLDAGGSGQQFEGGIVFEDDALLHHQFRDQLDALMGNVPAGCPLVMLGHYVDGWVGMPWAGIDPELKNLTRISSNSAWGAHAYWISSAYAAEALRRFDRPIGEIAGYATSELITRFSGGVLAYPPLALAEGQDSDIRDEDGLRNQRAVYGAWGWENYSPAAAQGPDE